MRGTDYIPGSDADFDSWQANFRAYVNANLAGLGLTATDPDVLAMNTLATDWATKYAAHITAQATAQSATQAKNASRRAFERTLRRLAQRLQISSAVDDTERAALGITVPDREPTSVPVPTTRPILKADTSQRLQITLTFTDEASPRRTSKPAGVMGCEIWVKIGGDPPADLSECQFLALDTNSPYTAVFTGKDANKTAHFIGRWVNSRGEAGPLSETVSATITG